jgi:hypothetical protein
MNFARMDEWQNQSRSRSKGRETMSEAERQRGWQE